jgi:hypothetical protein
MTPDENDSRMSNAAAVQTRIAAGCALISAVVWVAVWLHQSTAHGTTSVNEMRVVFGLTWMDTAKALPIAVLLLVPGAEVLVRRAQADRSAQQGSRATVVMGRTVQACLVVAAVAGAVDFWTFPFGNYDETFESRGDTIPVQFLACVMAGLVLLSLAVVRRRAENHEWAVLLVLAIGTFVASLWTPALVWPAIAWTLFAGWLWRNSDASTRFSAPN